MKYERGSFITVGSRDTLRGLHPTAQALYMWLSSYANETGNCFPSRKTLASDVGCSERTVDSMVDLLRENGLIEVKGRKDGDKQLSNLYKVLIVPPLAGDATPPSRTVATPLQNLRTNSNQLTQPTETRASARPPVFAYEEIITTLDEESGDSKSPRISGEKLKAYNELIAWSENERGFPFPKTTKLKQYRAFKLANENGITRDQLMTKWEDLACDKFWQKTGFDWMNVLQEIFKKPL